MFLLPAGEELALALDEHRAGLLEEREEDGDVGAVEAEDELLVEGVEGRVLEERGEERAVLELAERVDVLAELVELLLRRDALLAADVHVLGVRDAPARREVARDEAADEVLVPRRSTPPTLRATRASWARLSARKAAASCPNVESAPL